MCFHLYTFRRVHVGLAVDWVYVRIYVCGFYVLLFKHNDTHSAHVCECVGECVEHGS